jgi:hypothetical protein
MNDAIHHLTPAERAQLTTANVLLRELTYHHCHACGCELCRARTLTHVEEESSFHAPSLPAEEGGE